MDMRRSSAARRGASVTMAETCNKATPAPTAATLRMRHHRWRRRKGLRCLLIDLHSSEIDALVRRGLLSAELRDSERALRGALYTFLDRTLGARQ
jgi:hypothetical protein